MVRVRGCRLGARDWSTRDYRLDVYETLDALRPHVPEVLFAAAKRKLQWERPEVEVLDI